jgi:transcriptional regulator with GAF, ATPase, and Fis domain
MSGTDPIQEALAALGVSSSGEDPLRAVDDLLRHEPRRGGALADRLVPALAAIADERAAARALVALGAAHLGAGDAGRAREVLIEGLGLLAKDDRSSQGRGSLRLAQAELALGNAKAARAVLARTTAEILDVEDDMLQADLAGALRASGETLAADVVEHHRRTRRATVATDGRDRLEILSHLTRALNSGAAGTAEPLYAILRAILEETGAERGFIMVHDEERLRFELGLARSGRLLGRDDFAFSTTVVERALDAGKCTIIPDISVCIPVALASSARELGLQSAVCVPLRGERRRHGGQAATMGSLTSVRGIVGVLYVDARSAGTFGEKDARFFEILADCTVLALRARASAQSQAPSAATETPSGRQHAAKQGSDVEVPLRNNYDEFVTRDPPLRMLLALVDRVAPTDANVLIRGESGTGKELVARAIHRNSRHAKGPFVAINCAAIPEDLIASELFGHEKAAFTGATAAHAGLFERAHGGTLFLDEVGEMPAGMQSALLRVLQEGEVRRLGSDRTREVDVRVVAATHRNLQEMVEHGTFRHDLLFRLSVVVMRIPPLRERKHDIGLLVPHLLSVIAARNGGAPATAIEPDALARLEEHAYPGNVRELENILAAACVMARGSIRRSDIEAVIGRGLSGEAPKPLAVQLEGPLESIEKRAIEERLEQFQWNQVQAAASLGMDRNTLRRKILRYGITRGQGGT